MVCGVFVDESHFLFHAFLLYLFVHSVCCCLGACCIVYADGPLLLFYEVGPP
jgi:hypothetical protein